MNISAHTPTHILGIDWGTSNRRAYLVNRDGTCLARHADDQGMLAARPHFAQSIDSLLATLGLLVALAGRKSDTATLLLAGLAISLAAGAATPAARSGLATREATTPATATGRRPNRAERPPLSSRPGTRPRT